MPAIPALIAVAGQAISADAQRSASNKARDAQQRATDAAIAEQQRQYDTTRADQAPYREAGYSALEQLQQMLGIGGNPNAANYGVLTKQFTGANLQNDPGYQFGLKQGQQAVERSASAAGGLYSGATLKALQQYGQDYAGTKFNEAFNRDQTYKGNLFNQLSGVSGTGQTALQQIGAAGQNMANNVSSMNLGMGNANAANYLNQGNILSNLANRTASSFASMYGGGFGNFGGGQAGGSSWG